MNNAMWAMNAVETVLWAALAILFVSKGLHRRFPAMCAYLTLRAVATPLLVFLLYEESRPWGLANHLARVYAWGFLAAYLACTVLLYFICIEIFRSALAAFPGISKLAVVIFRWAAVVAVIVSLPSVPYVQRGVYLISDIAYGMMHSMSLLELCLLAFLCLSMKALRLSVRDLSFGIALGFGLMCSGDFILVSLGSRITSYADPLEFLYEAVILATLATWMTYCILPEPARKPVLMPASSTIYRWNEIASALGHTGTKVAVPLPASNFFLSDVERVVEKVLARNMRGRESET
ncbi:MAG: hypothetical protein ABSG10_08510 [Terracidiphilus sp.]|jgi:hypothetical protein